jgi:hypothetical protein
LTEGAGPPEEEGMVAGGKEEEAMEKHEGSDTKLNCD